MEERIRIFAAVSHKHLTAADWENSDYVPAAGEIIVYDEDEGDEGCKYKQVKVGDGSSLGKDLPFTVPIYNTNKKLLQDIGGIKADKHQKGFKNVPVTDLLNELLYPYVPPVINSFTMEPEAEVREKNTKIEIETANVSIEKKSKDIKKIVLYKNNTEYEIIEDDVDNGGDFSFNLYETLSGKEDVSYKIKIYDKEGTEVESNIQKYTFVYPYFYGVIDPETVAVIIDAGNNPEDDDKTEAASKAILDLTKAIRARGNNEFSFTTNGQRPVIAYPKDYGELKSIIDQNNFSQTWTKTIVEVDNETTIPGVDYYVYIGSISSAEELKFKFNY